MLCPGPVSVPFVIGLSDGCNNQVLLRCPRFFKSPALSELTSCTRKASLIGLDMELKDETSHSVMVLLPGIPFAESTLRGLGMFHVQGLRHTVRCPEDSLLRPTQHLPRRTLEF